MNDLPPTGREKAMELDRKLPNFVDVRWSDDRHEFVFSVRFGISHHVTFRQLQSTGVGDDLVIDTTLQYFADKLIEKAVDIIKEIPTDAKARLFYHFLRQDRDADS